MGRKASLSLLNALLQKKNAENVLTWYSNCAGSQVRALSIKKCETVKQRIAVKPRDPRSIPRNIPTPCWAVFPKEKKTISINIKSRKLLECTSSEKKMHELCVSTSLSSGIGRTGLRPPWGRRQRGARSATRDYALFLVFTSLGAWQGEPEVTHRNLGKTIGGQRPIRRSPLLESK